ncbi:type IV toxin-antitoxin system AbiEi family antitoxin domain-containing protein [Nocardia alni]|uniref:type IV toxin-antitoxin system AbiEi family antitoxin domain-containing protein n=1 Tax=Nocardia alni TaxID=2815723 RepID=UPI001C24AAB2|nr:type IV toxin-antitoxin system AbiEi family antitoxin domain-containing protein [Nocardia alni]
MTHRQVCRNSGTAGIHRRRDILARGVADEQLRRMCEGGALRRVRRGIYTEAQAYAALDPNARHRIQALAALPEMADDAVLSHLSAAAIYGAPIWGMPMDRLCITRNRRYGGRIKPHVKVHCAPFECVAEVDGMLVTTPARTVVDLGRTAPFGTAVVAGDWLVREFGLTATDLATELDLGSGRSGMWAARQVVKFLDPHSASAAESRSRVRLRELGAPIPQAQGEVFTAGGRTLGRVHFYFGDSGVVAMVDGAGPGGRRPIRTAQRRDIALLDNGFHLVRWSLDDLSGDAVFVRLHAALARPRSARPDGFIRPAPLPEPRALTVRQL